MAPELFSQEIQKLLDAADRAIERSRFAVEQRKQIAADCEKLRRDQETRSCFLREMQKPE
jgi:hypothetical protein